MASKTYIFCIGVLCAECKAVRSLVSDHVCKALHVLDFAEPLLLLPGVRLGHQVGQSEGITHINQDKIKFSELEQ